MRKSGSVVGSVALTLSVFMAAACTSWSTQSVSPREYLSGQAPPEVRITCADSSRVVVQSPRLEGDSLVGESTDSAKARRHAVPLSEIQSLEVRRKDPTKTTLFAES